MKQHCRLIAAALLIAGISSASAQTFPTVPSQTVIGRTAIGTGPAQAIPFATLLAAMGAQTSFTVNSVVFVGATSGSATVSAQAVAGTPAIKWPTQSGTVATTGTSPVTVDATTGAVGCATCVVGPGSATADDVATYNGTTGKLIKDSGIAAAWLPTARGQIPGIAAGTVASAGNVGELISANISFASRVSMSNASIANSVMQTVSLTPGDWDCSGNHGFETSGGGVATEYHVEISTTNNGSLVTAPNNGCTQGTHIAYTANQGQVFPNGPCQILITVNPTTVYQKSYSTFTNSQTMYGYERCRRMH